MPDETFPSIFAAHLVFLASSACAQTPPRIAQTRSVVPAEPAEVSGIQHAAHSTGPIIVNWHLKKAQGSANLIVNPDGTYLFSGDYKPAKPGKILDLVLALKSHVGATYLFRYVANVSGGDVQWSEQGKSTILKEDFKLFAPGHDWSGTYGFHLTADAAKIRKNEKEYCKNIAYQNVVLWVGPLGFPKYCQQFNAAWHN